MLPLYYNQTVLLERIPQRLAERKKLSFVIADKILQLTHKHLLTRPLASGLYTSKTGGGDYRNLSGTGTQF